MSLKRPRFLSTDFTVAWISALPLEFAAATEVLDSLYDDSAGEFPSKYILGRVGRHNVVLACLPAGQTDTVSAAAVVVELQRDFQAVKFALMVGIGGGVPSRHADIRLGDVVVSKPDGTHGGVVQYDRGKTNSGGTHQRTGFLNGPPPALLAAVSRLSSNQTETTNALERHMSFLSKRPDLQSDILFKSSYAHDGGRDCHRCDRKMAVKRVKRENDIPRIHFGTIASGNKVIKDGESRDRLSKELGTVYCFEMEAAGMMNYIPSLVIRGISDYSDSHKHKEWQPFAAAVAAACAKEILTFVSSSFSSAGSSMILSRESSNASAGNSSIYSEKRSQASFERLPTSNPNTIKSPELTTQQRKLLIDSLRKPGAGKSTIMKFAFTNEKKTGDAIVISFWFHARGGSLEKSTLGLYRSLVVQLLNTISVIPASILPLKSVDDFEDILTYKWTVPKVRKLFVQTLKLLKRPVICYIDALDECEETQLREMVSFFEDLREKLPKIHKLRLNVCFSSRHYPNITVKNGIELVLENQKEHHRDINAYINNRLSIGDGPLALKIKKDILNKSSGIFLWVFLVIKILQIEYDHGQIPKLQRRLNEIPEGLDELFEDILTRDSRNKDALLLCLQWILFASRPLKREELYYAIVAGVEPDLEWAFMEANRNDMERYILSSSKGLTEMSQSTIPVVQFIHDTVPYFLLNNDGLRKLYSQANFSHSALGHDALKRSCEKYLMIDTTKFLSSTPPPGSSRNAVKPRPQAPGKFPFLEYAVRNILYHADSAHGFGITQDIFFDTFNLGGWIGLNNFFNKHTINTYKKTTHLLYIFADKSLPSLIEMALTRTVHMDIKGSEKYSYPLNVALAHARNKTSADEEALRALLKLDLVTKFESGSCLVGHDLYEEVISFLVGNNSLNHSERTETILSQAMAIHEFSVVKVLVATKRTDITFRTRTGQTILSWAAERQQEDIVKLLLEYPGLNANLKDYNGRTPLSWAAETGQEAIVAMLLERPEVASCTQDNQDQTPLSMAAKHGHETVVKLILSKCRNIHADTRDSHGRTPLALAAMSGHGAIVNYLLKCPAVDANSMDSYNQTPLALASMSGHEAVVELLLKLSNVQVNSVNYNERTPLALAAMNGHDCVVKALLAHPDIMINQLDDSHRTALSLAESNGHEGVVKLLQATEQYDPNSEKRLNESAQEIT